MDSHRKLTIAEWAYAPLPLSKSHPSARPYASTGAIGLIGTLLLHTLVLHSALSGVRARRGPLPEDPRLGSTLEKADTSRSGALVLVDLLTIGKTDVDSAEGLDAARAMVKKAPIAVIHPDPSPMIDIGKLQIETSQEQASLSTFQGENAIELARLSGIYSGQIQARVERIWRRPRSPVNEGAGGLKPVAEVEYFRCQVQIVQDSVGNVQDVRLRHCNGSLAWQHSLVGAIQQSSPLPAPPDPKVFTNSIMMNFVGYAYAKDSSDDEYEMPPVKTAQTDVLR